MFYQPEIETMPRADLRALQLELMRASVARCAQNIPFFRQSFAAVGIDPDELVARPENFIESLDDIAKFPFVIKQNLRDAYPDGMFAVPRAQVARIHASSGTTGQATICGHTATDLKNWGDCFARGIYMVGGGPESTMQIAYGYGLFSGGLGAHRGAEEAGCAVVPASTGNTERQLQMMRDLKVDLLACTPSYALHIADTAIAAGIDPKRDLYLRGGIFGAEPASENVRAQIADKLGIQYCDVYGLSEIMGPGVAMECGVDSGLHLAEDHFYAEIVDPQTLEVLPDGQVGELVITTLTRQCCPLVRYRTRDLTRIISEPCGCGRTHRKIDRLMGRTDDMLIIRGVNVFPKQVEQVITSFPEIAPYYQITLTTRGTLDAAELAVETAPDFSFDEIRALEALKRKIARALRDNLQVAMDIRIVEPNTIERSESKAKRIVDLRQM